MGGPWRFVVGLALVAGIGARFYALDAQPIWHDEVYTRAFATGHGVEDWGPALYRGEPVSRDEVLAFQRLDPERGLVDTLVRLAADEPQHPPIYYLAARLWIEVFGESIGALRALSGLLGLLLLLAAFHFGRELFGRAHPTRPDPALIFVALVALSPLVVAFAREAREYTLAGALALASSAALLRAVRASEDEGSEATRAFLAFGALTAVGLYTSLGHGGVVLAQVLFVGARARGRWTPVSRGTLVSLIGAGLLFSPWALAVIRNREALDASLAWSRQIVVPRGELLSSLVFSLSRPFVDLGPAPRGVVPLALALSAATLLVGSLVHLARRGPARGRLLVLILFALPLALLVVPDLVVGGIRSLSTRYLFVALLAGSSAVVYSLATIERASLRGSLTALVLLSAAFGTLSTITTPVPWPRDLSAGLPTVARAIDESERPLVIGDRERHHPGNLMALASMVKPETRFLLLDHPQRDTLRARAEAEAGEERWPPAGLPAGHTLFLYSPVPELRDAIEAAVGVSPSRVHQDLHVECWRLGP